MANYKTIVDSDDPYINGLTCGIKWSLKDPQDPAMTRLTYSFPTDPSAYDPAYAGTNDSSQSLYDQLSAFAPFKAGAQSSVRMALNMFSAVANIKFVEDTGTGQSSNLRFGFSTRMGNESTLGIARVADSAIGAGARAWPEARRDRG